MDVAIPSGGPLFQARIITQLLGNLHTSFKSSDHAWRMILNRQGANLSDVCFSLNHCSKEKIMPRFVIERDLPEIGSAYREALKGASQKSNSVLEKMHTT